MMIYPGFMTDSVGLVLGLLFIGRNAISYKRKNELLTKQMINK